MDIRERIKEEFVKIKNDFIYGIKKYCKVEHPIRGKILFNLFPFQEETLKQFFLHRFTIILKSRQMGISTLVAAFILFKMIFHENYKVLIIATTQDVAANLVKKIQVMNDGLPIWLRGTAVSDNKLKLELSNGSFVKAVSSSATSGRSEALSLLVIDEAAFVDRFSEIWTSAQMTLSTGGSAIILSTPNGVGGLFHKLFEAAEDSTSIEELEGLEKFNPIRLPWHLHPERDQKWREQQTALLGVRQAAQECDCSFLSSGATVVDPEILQWYEKESGHIIDPIQKRGIDGELWIFKQVDFNKSYVITADVARGDGTDNSAFHVCDIETLEIVAEYKGKIGTTEYGKLLYQIGMEYNNAFLAIENTGIGWSVVQVLIDMRYPNLYYSYKNDPFLDEQIHLRKGFDLKEIKDKVPGISTSYILRPIFVSKIEEAFRNRALIIHSKRTLSELRVFIWKNGRGEAQQGYNDDLVMALGMLLYLRDTALKLKQIGIDLTKKTLNSTYKVIHKNVLKGSTQWDYKDSKGNSQSLKWLL